MSTPPNDCGPYSPIEIIATGASAEVWLATDDNGEPVALKIARDAMYKPQLKREAELLAKAPHPGLIAVKGSADDGSWIALERIPGKTMDAWAKGKFPDEVGEAAIHIVDALIHLHEAGIVHGDIKPSNVLVDPQGRPHLLDLGVATLEGDRASSFKGTLGYAAPELLRHEKPTVATDMYGLGALLYTCVTGRTPFVAPDPAALTYLPLVSLPPPPSAFVGNMTSSFEQLIMALLSRDPERRPKSLAKVREVLAKPQPRLVEPVLGMHDEREELRQAVVGVADGEARVVVLYGPPGSGRRTLIGETVEHARREGMPYIKGHDLKEALSTLRSTHKPSVMVHRASNRGAQKLAKVLLSEHLPMLLLLHAERPVPSLSEIGAIELTPAPFSLRDVETLCKLHGVELTHAESWWRASHGLPIAVLGRIRAARRQKHGLPFNPRELPTESARVLEAVRKDSPIGVFDLADQLGMGQHQLLDHCEVLFAEGVLTSIDDGAALQAVMETS